PRVLTPLAALVWRGRGHPTLAVSDCHTRGACVAAGGRRYRLARPALRMQPSLAIWLGRAPAFKALARAAQRAACRPQDRRDERLGYLPAIAGDRFRQAHFEQRVRALIFKLTQLLGDVFIHLHACSFFASLERPSRTVLGSRPTSLLRPG